MTEKRTIRTQIIVAVVSGLIIAAVLWLTGHLDDVWRSLKSLAVFLRELAWLRLTFPLWVIIPVVLVLVVVIRVTRMLATSPKSSPDIPDPRMIAEYLEQVYSQLNDPQHKILRILGRADGRAVDIDQLQRETQINRLRVGAALEALENFGLVQEGEGWPGQPVYFLSRGGRDLLIGKGEV